MEYLKYHNGNFQTVVEAVGAVSAIFVMAILLMVQIIMRADDL